MIRRPSRKTLIAVLVVLAAGVAAWLLAPRPPAVRGTPLGLFTTLPLYWNEAADISAMLDPAAEKHWARGLIEERRDLRPLDVLSPEALAPFADMLIAQPRALAPAENVALDDWVRAGGHVLLFADPLLTQHSGFALGDRRRPMDVALLSPILNRWGLSLDIDEAQPEGEREAQLLGGPFPVDEAGRLALVATAPDAPASCRLLEGGLAADCAIGQGHALIVADAALLDSEGAGSGEREAALSRLLAAAYARD
ncbi:hypothetical protein [Erythrobacter sp. SG61-1L]|uniref:hypothetical protein n=1 Tax=Erythrobacter sp. SG61-1L TaxID=1603897 RepID=UPI0006C8FB11|nr:hypothetical protein [Erythrobacter sp. SG61-1L]